MYSIIQKIYEKNNKILKEGLKKVLSGEDVSSLTVAIKEFTDVLGKELFSEIAKQLDEIIFEDNKKKKQYEPVRFQEKSLITKNGKAKFEYWIAPSDLSDETMPEVDAKSFKKIVRKKDINESLRIEYKKKKKVS